MPAQPVAPSLPGHAAPTGAAPDPLAVISVEVEKKRRAREARRAKIKADLASRSS
jgi:Iap family predicted aminopeptidase